MLSRHQLAFVTPGISPLIAISRSLLRPKPNLLYTPRGRPVNKQRLRTLTGLALRGNICSFILAERRSSLLVLMLLITTSNSFRYAANFFTVSRRFKLRLIKAILPYYPQFLNGNLNATNNALASVSVFAVVVIVIFIPRNASTLSYSISGKIICSLTPIL